MNEILSVIKKWMTRLLAGIATVLLSVMTLLVLYQVFTRYVLNSPAAFTEELVRYFLIWTGFIGAAYAFITREHMCLVLVRFKLALSAQKVFSALLGIPRSLVYAMAPISGLFIILAQIINIYEDVTGITIEGGNE